MGNERRRGSFIKAVEVFPPVFPRTPRGESSLDLGAEQSRFVQAVEPVAGIADYVLVADLKDPSVLKLSSLHSAALLKAKLKVRAVPVITARDANRPAVTASVLTAFALGLESLFLVWGDRFGGAGDPKNVYDFRSLSEVIAEARSLAERAHVDATIFAPVDLSSGRLGLDRGRARLSAGADFLLAQPPTADSKSTLQSHVAAIRAAGLTDRVLIGAFPFRGVEDIRRCARTFSWTLPPRLTALAKSGPRALTLETRRVVRLAEAEGLKGVYLSTRGTPRVALDMLS